MAARQALESQPRPAEPLLASQLIRDEELDALLEDVCTPCTRNRAHELKLLATGVKSLDGALTGGLESGRVVEISSETGIGNELYRTLLVNSLLKYRDSTAAVIDTTGNFDILRLYSLILYHLQQNDDARLALRSLYSSAGVQMKDEDVAAELLNRVKIMRAFDFVGVREAVGEIKDELEVRDVRVPQEIGIKNKFEEEEVRRSPPVPPPQRTFVADSEDEEDDDEMLFESESTVVQPALAVRDSDAPEQSLVQNVNEEPQGNTEKDQGRVKFILIDNLAHVLNPVLKKDFIPANELASTFLITLTRLTHTHNLHTILVNPITAPRPSSPNRINQPNQSAPLPPQQPQQPAQSPSIFASSVSVPSLMNVLPRYVDMGLLVTRIPRKKMDARVHYSDEWSGDGGRGKKRGVVLVSVMEVVSDRWKGRVGAWGSFTESENGIRDLP